MRYHIHSKADIRPAIVIPTHKSEISPEEKISLFQCQKILGNYAIYLLLPQGVSTKAYEAIFPSLQILRVAPEKMSSISAYNKFMISPYIFNVLQSYTHVLIHEPDAIVLKDDLQFWCEQDFDYIGAPWFSSEAPNEFNLKATGNYGLSLFKIKTVKDLFTSNPRWYSFSMIIRDLVRGIRGQKRYLKRGLLAMGAQGRIANASVIYQDHCDIFWSYLIPKIAPHFRIAPPQTAIFFSWEKCPGKSLAICKGELPFGIHAWSKYDLEFLRPLLIKSGVSLLD